MNVRSVRFMFASIIALMLSATSQAQNSPGKPHEKPATPIDAKTVKAYENLGYHYGSFGDYTTVRPEFVRNLRGHTQGFCIFGDVPAKLPEISSPFGFVFSGDNKKRGDPFSPITDEDLRLLSYQPWVKEHCQIIWLAGASKVTDEGIKHLVALKNLKLIHVGGTSCSRQMGAVRKLFPAHTVFLGNGTK